MKWYSKFYFIKICLGVEIDIKKRLKLKFLLNMVYNASFDNLRGYLSS